MRVVQAARFGGPEVLVPSEAPDPLAGPGQVVVDVS
jgi:NADPH2:quinone reductase